MTSRYKNTWKTTKQVGDAGENRVVALLAAAGFSCTFSGKDKEKDFLARGLNFSFTAEVKHDIWHRRSGNIAVEYFNPRTGKLSGLAASSADIWFYVIRDSILATSRFALWDFFWREKPLRDVWAGGDGNTCFRLYKDSHLFTIFHKLEDPAAAPAVLHKLLPRCNHGAIRVAQKNLEPILRHPQPCRNLDCRKQTRIYPGVYPVVPR